MYLPAGNVKHVINYEQTPFQILTIVLVTPASTMVLAMIKSMTSAVTVLRASLENDVKMVWC